LGKVNKKIQGFPHNSWAAKIHKKQIDLYDYEVVCTKRKLTFFIYPCPKGSEENQFAPILGWGKQIDFQNEPIVLVQTT
jgi:hypothetical protein